MRRNVSIIKDALGKSIVFIHDIRFQGRQSIDWKAVERYLKQYIGEAVKIAEYSDIVYIGNDFPDEYSNSEDTVRRKGALAKAKANAVQGVPELVEIAVNKRFKENLNKKHKKNAKYGWYRYDSRFALPVYSINGEIERYNIFCAEVLIRHDNNGKLCLYDIVNIRKETSTPLEQ